MKKLRKIICLLGGVILLAACGKKDNPDPAQQDIDPFQYYIAGKFPGSAGEKAVTVPYAIIIKPNAQAVIFTGDGGSASGNYTYQNGHLVFTLNGGSYIFDYTISNNTITGFNSSGGIRVSLTANSLEKTPPTNAFTGLFKGSLSTTGNLQLLVPDLLFTGSKYGFGINASPAANLDYTLQNNGVATSETGANGTLSLFVMAGGKLEIGRYTPTDVNGGANVDYGTYTKQ
jgi:hypothetical protein